MPDASASKSQSKPRVKSADRTLSIFEYFETTREPATLGEIAHALGFPVSSALALLRSLQDSGYLIQHATQKTYFPSIRLATLGSWLTSSVFHNGKLLRIVDDLAQKTEETVFLGVQNGLSAQYIHVVQAAHLLRYHPPIGTQRSLLQSTLGKVILAAMPPDERERMVAKLLRQDPGSLAEADPASVLQDLEAIRAVGFACGSNRITAGATVIAVPVPQHPDRPAMAIGVGGPSDRIVANQERFRDMIMTDLRHLDE